MKHKRRLIRTISYISALVLVLGTFALVENYKRRDYENRVAIAQQSALSELSRYLNNIELSLTKGIYASTPPMVSSLASALWRDSTGAKTSLSQLDTGEAALKNVYKFLSQVGEFTMSLNRKVAAGEDITEEERGHLDKLLGYATGLCEQLDYLEFMLQTNDVTFEQVKSNLSIGENIDSVGIDFISVMGDAEQTLTDYPTLLYDGPFADNIEQKESKIIKSNAEISEDSARTKAAKYSGIGAENLSLLDTDDGKMPAYIFSGNGKTISITKNGGFLIYMLSDVYAGEEKISHEEAVKKAKAYLDEQGFKDMKESYYSSNDGITTINFAYAANDISYYPDLVKVSVSLDTGEVTSVDARGYIMNHHERKPDTPAFTMEAGRDIISSDLTIKNMRYSVIPKDNGDERYAYEYHCADKNGQEVLIYVDTISGDEAEILLLLYGDGGILTK